VNNPIYEIRTRLPESWIDKIRGSLIHDMYHSIDSKYMQLDIIINGPIYDWKINNSNIIFYCSTEESWKMVNRRLNSEAPVINSLINRIENNNYRVFHDIGANIGTFSCVVSPFVDSTIAFEPLEQNIELLSRNAELNKQNIQIEKIAISDSNGETEIQIPISTESGAEQATIEKSHPASHDVINTEIVTTRSIDKLINENRIPKPDIQKIDVEGAGVKVLNGMKELLSSDPPCIYIEPHQNKEQIVNKLVDFGYEIEYIKTDREGSQDTVVGLPE
jgi:FkbM family methyltransferase